MRSRFAALRRLAVAALVGVLVAVSAPAFAGKGATFTNDYLKLVFNATPIANVADNAASAPATSLYLTLHSADPSTTAGSGTVGTQNASEIAYTSYARATVARTSSGFTVTGNTVTLTSTVAFAAGTGGTGTATYWGVGTSASGTGKLLYSGTISPSIVCGAGITPQLTSATTITEN